MFFHLSACLGNSRSTTGPYHLEQLFKVLGLDLAILASASCLAVLCEFVDWCRARDLTWLILVRGAANCTIALNRSIGNLVAEWKAEVDAGGEVLSPRF